MQKVSKQAKTKPRR